MTDIEIEIDGRKMTVRPDQTIIQAADEAGIYIPRFCYHKHLSIPANCRMCLVDVEKAAKPLPACATPLTPGMKISTQSSKAITAQRDVMEFLLINHPLDCPICDQGGECELQDLAMEYGSSKSHYNDCKRSVSDEDLGPLIATEMTRCIYCTRCVRFGQEVAGLREMGATYRGEHTEIGTYIKHAIQSEVSGNIIDLCPVGALTSKPYRFKARAWELNSFPGISPHDCMGSHLHIHTQSNKVMRIVSRENANINETWLSDRDRFGYAGLNHPDRIKEPLVKINGKWQSVEWQKAFEVASNGLRDIITQHGSDKIGGLASPSATVEELYLFQKIIRGLGSPHVDHRLREIDMRDQTHLSSYPGFSLSFSDFEKCDAIVIIGSHLQRELPLLALRLRKAALAGAKVFVINPVNYAFNFPIQTQRIVAPHQMSAEIENIMNALKRSDQSHDIADQLHDKKKVGIILGQLAIHHQEAAELRYQAQQLAKACHTEINVITDGANSAGAWMAGAIPHRFADGTPANVVGLNAYEMLENPRKAYLLLNVEPDLDCANPTYAINAMKQARFVVACSLYRNACVDEHAHVILPITPFTETSGTFVNAMGQWQSFAGTVKPFESSRPAWKVLRVLGNYLQLGEFQYQSSDQVRDELKARLTELSAVIPPLPAVSKKSYSDKTLSRIGDIPIYAVDILVRHSKPLQEAQAILDHGFSSACIHPKTAAQFGLQENNSVLIKQSLGEMIGSILFDETIAYGAVRIAGGLKETSQLGDLFGEVELIAGGKHHA
jgi:NADH-quinone oxidoreductase subunit G